MPNIHSSIISPKSEKAIYFLLCYLLFSSKGQRLLHVAVYIRHGVGKIDLKMVITWSGVFFLHNALLFLAMVINKVYFLWRKILEHGRDLGVGRPLLLWAESRSLAAESNLY